MLKPAVLLFVAVLGAVVIWWSWPDGTPPSPGQLPAFPPDRAQLVVPIRAGVAEATLPVASAAYRETAVEGAPAMLNRLVHARAVALALWTRPEIGGKYYASRIAAQCAQLAFTGRVVEEPTYDAAVVSEDNRLRVANTFDSIKRRCDQFTADEFEQIRLDQVADQDGDPLVMALRAFTKAAQAGIDPRGRASALAGVLATADPLLVEEIGPRLALNRTPQGLGLLLRRG